MLWQPVGLSPYACSASRRSISPSAAWLSESPALAFPLIPSSRALCEHIGSPLRATSARKRCEGQGRIAMRLYGDSPSRLSTAFTAASMAASTFAQPGKAKHRISALRPWITAMPTGLR